MSQVSKYKTSLKIFKMYKKLSFKRGGGVEEPFSLKHLVFFILIVNHIYIPPEGLKIEGDVVGDTPETSSNSLAQR